MKKKHIIPPDGEEAEILDALKEEGDHEGEDETSLNLKQARDHQFGN